LRISQYLRAENPVERRSEIRKQVDQYYNVEFLNDGLDGTHLLKIWNRSPKSMCLLVKENSDILPRLKVGDTLKMIYYPRDSLYPRVYLGAVIQHITKKDQRRLNNHYLVGLETLERQDQRTTH